MKLWDFFSGPDILEQTLINPYAKFRLIDDEDRILAELPRE